MSFIHDQDLSTENLDTTEMFAPDISEDISDLLVHLEMPADMFASLNTESFS